MTTDFRTLYREKYGDVYDPYKMDLVYKQYKEQFNEKDCVYSDDRLKIKKRVYEKR